MLIYSNKEYSSWSACRIGTTTYTWASYASSTYGLRGIDFVKMPYNYSINDTVSTHNIDSSYPTNFTATAKSRMTVFGSNHESVGNHYVDAGDVCTIHEVYTDGCCRVTYPAGSTTEMHYCYISNFTWTLAPTWASISVNKNDFVAGETISFTFNGNNSPTSYIIGIDKDGTRVVTEESGNSYSISRLNPGNYSAYVTAKNSMGSADSSKVYFTVNYKYPGPVDVGTDFYAYIINTEVWRHATNDDTNVALHEETGYPNQIWKFERQDDLSYKIINMYDNKALEVQGISPDIGANVQVHTYDGNNAQLWYIYGTSGAYRLRAKCTDCFLDLKNGSSDDSDNLRMWEDLDNADQKFQIWKIDYFKEIADIGDEFYGVILMDSAWKPIANEDGNVVIQSESGDASQVWKFKRNAEGSYNIISAKDGNYLTVTEYNGENGSNVAVYKENGKKDQKWFFHREDGGFSISTACNGVSHNQVLSIEGSVPDDGANVNMYQWIGASDQIFSIYIGEECVPLKSATLSVTPGNAEIDTQFSWTEVYGRDHYDLKLWNGTYWEGDSIYSSWNNTGRNHSTKLQAGYYEGYVDTRHALDCKMSNVVCFTVNPVLMVAKQNNGEYNFSWNPVLSADSFNIEVVNAKTGQTVISKTVSKETTSLNMSINAGDYKARVVSSFSKAYQPSDGSGAIIVNEFNY